MVKIPKKIHGYRVIVDNKHKYYGTTDDVAKTVIINKKKSLKAGGVAELKDTIKHERYHVEHPNATEKQTEENIKHKETSQVDMTDLAIKGLV